MAISIAAGLVLTACAEPTAYMPIDAKGRGYADASVEENRYRVSFSGNTVTSRDVVETYLLYRAAEVTLEKGFEHFVIADQDTEKDTTYYSSFSRFGHGFGGRYYSSFNRFGVGADFSTLRPRNRYTAYANIVVKDGPKTADDPNA